MDVGLGYIHDMVIDEETKTSPANVSRKKEEAEEKIDSNVNKIHKAGDNNNLVNPKIDL
jgi:hypothetical protein